MQTWRPYETCPKSLHLNSNHQPQWLALGSERASTYMVYCSLSLAHFCNSSLFIFTRHFFFFFALLSLFLPLSRFPLLLFEIPKKDPKEERRFLPWKEESAPLTCALTARPKHERPCSLQPYSRLVHRWGPTHRPHPSRKLSYATGSIII